MLEYRVYRDQQRGWRITSPNLEQTGLLRIDYDDLDDCIADDEVWEQELPAWIGDDRDPHPILASASAETRELVARALLDFLRRELALKVDVLDADRQEELKRRSSQQLIAPWAIDENEPLTYGTRRVPALAVGHGRSRRDVHLAAQWLRPVPAPSRDVPAAPRRV